MNSCNVLTRLVISSMVTSNWQVKGKFISPAVVRITDVRIFDTLLQFLLW